MNIAQVDYDGLIPNNVALGKDVRVKRALEKWHPGYLNWWNDMGPEGFQQSLVYLRTAVSVDPKGWAKFDYVRMPEYRWGALLAQQMEGRKASRDRWSICEPPCRSTRKAGPSSTTCACRNIAGACCWRRRWRAARSISARTKASRPGRTCRAN